MAKPVVLFAAFSIFAILGISFAQADSLNTKYTYYLIAGDTAASLHASMKRKGPRVYGGRAYASATMIPNPELSTQHSSGGCAVEKFNLRMSFAIRLPKLDKSLPVSKAVRSSFEEFYMVAKRHEETHRSIWLACAREAEAQVRKIRANTCWEVEERALQLMSEYGQHCDARQLAFDAVEHERLRQILFIKQAIRP
jgi:predicted secreted Zn-dependent protease